MAQCKNLGRIHARSDTHPDIYGCSVKTVCTLEKSDVNLLNGSPMPFCSEECSGFVPLGISETISRPVQGPKRFVTNVEQPQQTPPEAGQGNPSKSISLGPLTDFDRVTVINLARRPDRLEQFNKEMGNWPFRKPERLEAVDGNRCKAPSGFKEGDYAWACFQSHRRAVEDAVNAGSQSLMILEDDATLADGFTEDSKKFLAALPDDWEFAFFGGRTEGPVLVSPNVAKIVHIDRCHAYAVRGRALTELYRYWHEWHTGHCDWALSRWVANFNSYCAVPWLVGQRGGWSDITYNEKPPEFWHHGPMIHADGHMQSEHAFQQAKDVQQHHLTWMQKVTTLAGTVGHTLAGGAQFADQAMIDERLKICSGCSFNENGRCTLCTCSLTSSADWTNKLAHKASACPHNPPKWGAVE